MRFFLRMIPPTTTFQDKGLAVSKSGKPYMYDRDEAEEVKAKLIAYLAKYRPPEPLKGPVELVVRWFYPEEDSHRSGDFKTTKPDLDNMNKLLGDALQELGFVKDDAHIAHLDITKMYSDLPGVQIILTEMEE